ncbi:MAG: DUF2283 domain-containing protein [Elusimicrobia bacterium]|nr:DUF2283 domain-containing protein [Elusimicrobiota bacterium]
MKTRMKVWFDREGDYLEVLFDSKTPGFFQETKHDQVMQKVDSTGRVLGFSVLKISQLKKKPFEVALAG